MTGWQWKWEGAPRLRELEAALVAELQEDLDLALRVGVLLALGFNGPELCTRLRVGMADVRRSKTQLKRATRALPATE
jgi:hypothetical protein